MMLGIRAIWYFGNPFGARYIWFNLNNVGTRMNHSD